jgi:hypothetical protein
MKAQEFSILFNERIDKIRSILGAKTEEYATSTDVLHNFKAAAELKSETDFTTPAQSAWGMALKHLISIQDMIFKEEKPNFDLIDEKIGDAINYLILIEAILKEKS